MVSRGTPEASPPAAVFIAPGMEPDRRLRVRWTWWPAGQPHCPRSPLSRPPT